MKTASISMALMFAQLVAAAQDVRINARPPDAGIKINVNGSRVETPLAPPVMINGRVMVPLRGVMQEFDAQVEWVPEQRVVIARRQNIVLTLGIGQKYGTVGERVVPLDTPATIINGRTLVPLRFVASALDAYVMWDSPNRTVVITSRI